MTGRPTAATWLLGLATPLVGAAAFVPAFRGWAILLVLLAAGVLPVAMVVLGRRLQVRPGVVAAATSIVGVVAAAGVVRAGPPVLTDVPTWRDAPAGSALSPLVDATARLVTGPRPVPTDAEAMVPVALLVMIVALVVALRIARTGQLGVAPLIGATALYTAAQLLTAGGGDPVGGIAATLLAVTCLGWVLVDRSEGPRLEGVPAGRGRTGRLRRSWPGGLPRVGAVVAACGVVLAVGAVTVGQPFEPREHIAPPVTELRVGHPLTQVPVWQASGDLELFRVGGSLPDRLRLVGLADYDGITWHAGTGLSPLGSGEPPLPLGQEGGRMEAEVTLTGLLAAPAGAGDWLPAAGTVTEISVPALVDVWTGSVLSPAATGAHAPRTPAYRVVAEVDVPGPTLLRDAAVPARDEVRRYLDLPRLPEELADLAELATAASSTRWEQVEAIAHAVTGERTIVSDAVGGSSYARISEYLISPEDDGGQVGSNEQVATSFAVLARAVGLPSRVVVGFEVPERGPEGIAVVRGKHATVWPEVYLVGAGWVSVDVGSAATGTLTRDSGGAPVELDSPAEQAGADELPAARPQASSTTAPVDIDLVPVVRGGALALGGLLVLLLVAGLTARQVRRARLRRLGPVGAWQHVEDSLLLAGTPPAPGDTAGEIADGVGIAAVHELAVEAERAAFARHGARTDRRTRRAAWTTAVRAGRRLRRSAPVRRRLIWAVHPGPLRRSRRPRPSGPRTRRGTSARSLPR